MRQGDFGETSEGTIPSAAPPPDSKKAIAPAVVDLLSMTLMMTFDGIILGKYSSTALAGGGMSLYVLFFLFTIFITFVLGAAVPISRHLGAGERDAASSLFGKAMGTTLIIAVAFSVVSYIFRGFIFGKVFGASGDVEKAAVDYFTGLIIFMPAIALNFTGTGILRSIGDATAAMKANLTANLVNAFAAILLVYGHSGLGIPSLGALGAALALGGAQFVGFLIQLRQILGGRTSVRLRLRDMVHPQLSRLKRIVKTGLPATAEQFIWMGGQLILIAFIARIGEKELAAHQILVRLTQTIGVIFQGFAFGNMALCGRKIGAGQEEGVKSLARKIRLLSLSTGILFAVLVFIFRAQIAGLFSYDGKVISLVIMLLPILAAVLIPKSLTMITASELRARGDLVYIAIVCLITVIVDIIGLSAISLFVFGWGLAGVWVAHALDELVRYALHMLRLRRGIVIDV